jgi:hypothetical protein
MMLAAALLLLDVPPPPPSFRYEPLPTFEGVCSMVARDGSRFRVGLKVEGSRHEERTLIMSPIDESVYLPEVISLGPQYARQSAIGGNHGVWSTEGRFFTGSSRGDRQILGTYVVESGDGYNFAELKLGEAFRQVNVAVGLCAPADLDEIVEQ